MKRTNKGAQSRQRRDQPPAEFVEKRPPAEGNFVQTAVTGTQGPEAASIGLDRVREAAKRDKDLCFTNLLHHIDIGRLHAAYQSLNPKAAAGVDDTKRTFLVSVTDQDPAEASIMPWMRSMSRSRSER